MSNHGFTKKPINIAYATDEMLQDAMALETFCRCDVCEGWVHPPFFLGVPIHAECWRWASLVNLGQMASADYVARQIQEYAK